MPPPPPPASDLTGNNALFANTEGIINEVRNGRMVIITDHADRENEGDLLIPAQMVTPKAINFMATHGRGLVCLALTAARVRDLNLPLMAVSNQSRYETAFTVSIEARKGITTGISAHDRAHTIAVAIDADKTGDDLITPGHVFPLKARTGGVLVRAGHTEAAVDIARLAGLNPAGVICEIMNENGTMAQLSDLQVFAQKHGLKIGTIADLIAYRRRYDNLVVEVAQRSVQSVFGGAWTMRIFRDEIHQAHHIALTKGTIAPGVWVRMHTLDPVRDVLGVHDAGTVGDDGGSAAPAPAFQVPTASDINNAMRAIAKHGNGAVVLLCDSDMDMTDFYTATDAPVDTGDVHGQKKLKKYGLGAQILASMGVTTMVLLSNSPAPHVVGLDAYGLSVQGVQPIPQTG